jgi:hypothetical protein
VAGGQYPRSWGTEQVHAGLSRLGITPAGPAGPPPAPELPPADRPAARPSRSTPRHVWLRGVPGLPDVDWPALLIEWRRRPDAGESGAWMGRVVFATAAPEGMVVVDRWVPADRLRPAPAAGGGQAASDR